MITNVLAQCTVSDPARAERWYTQLFEREPDRRPMEGLLEWHLANGAGVQVWTDADRAGASSVVLITDDLDAQAARLGGLGLTDQTPQPGGGQRILSLTDPDGNRVVLHGR